ncbi:hypothetical protein EDC01DRAFT_729216 [Geopyxis carbonaria]|nr:hypothetical protein EDC01DRAFT_729216 [Geopyxis carbonaria]
MQRRNTVKRVGKHNWYAPYHTPQKSRLHGAFEALDAPGALPVKQDIFAKFGFSRRSGYRELEAWRKAKERDAAGEINQEVQTELNAGEIEQAELVQAGKESIHDDVARRLGNSTWRTETRGRKKKISQEQVKRMEEIIEENGREGHRLSWNALAHEAGVEASETTVRLTMGVMNFRHCKTCKKKWVNPSTAEHRVDWSRVMLERYPDPDDWKDVRFSDEIHFGYSQGWDTPYVLCKPGCQTCPDCIGQDVPPDDKYAKKVHAWAAVGYNFKSKMIFYDSGNANGKMTHKCYVEQILEPVVKPWLQDPTVDRFVLEEDGDSSGHGGGRDAWTTTITGKRIRDPEKRNLVQKWKHENQLEFYFNCHSSPDLSPIENCWKGPKSHVNSRVHWDARTTKVYALEGWEAVSQEHINERVLSMPQRLKDCIELEGQFTGY